MVSVGEEVHEQLGLGPQVFFLGDRTGAGRRRQTGMHPTGLPWCSPVLWARWRASSWISQTAPRNEEELWASPGSGSRQGLAQGCTYQIHAVGNADDGLDLILPL